PDGKLIEVSMADLGIKMPVVVTKEKIRPVTYYPESPDNVNGVPGGAPRFAGPEAAMSPGTAPGGAPAADQPKTFKLRKSRCIVQFCWQQQPRGQRMEKAAQKKAAAASTAASTPEAPQPSS